MSGRRQTNILPVDAAKLGKLLLSDSSESLLDEWDIELDDSSPDAANMRHAAFQLQSTDVPVAFPTETVYGLGADATRSSAVQGIYQAKQRPFDNPLIVHISSLKQLRSLLQPNGSHNKRSTDAANAESTPNGNHDDPIPSIYKPLIRKFWPGPLTIILPNPKDSVLAPEVTAGLNTFGARMPGSLLALVLIKLAGIPLAAPSANASTKPSPTAAEHVKYDLNGRIDTIIDGGPCDVGVESTVVDGLSYPPSILRPGGISMEQLRQCPGWENAIVGYRDASEKGTKPRAPGMKYRHYSPKATVVLYEADAMPPSASALLARIQDHQRVGIIRTSTWSTACGLSVVTSTEQETPNDGTPKVSTDGQMSHASEPQLEVANGSTAPFQRPMSARPGFLNLVQSFALHIIPTVHRVSVQVGETGAIADIWEINLGRDTQDIARGLFSALRQLDREDVDVIFVEGIQDGEGGVAAAVMNRLRKAAEVKVRD
ncbi:hypothetical protein LTR04_003511 [Oleoguttula sp. CCFEE 6159]|nr:hypothetical protein LTR04_003511 [Oleoguttula sp. CCFEE 6159]